MVIGQIELAFTDREAERIIAAVAHVFREERAQMPKRIINQRSKDPKFLRLEWADGHFEDVARSRMVGVIHHELTEEEAEVIAREMAQSAREHFGPATQSA